MSAEETQGPKPSRNGRLDQSRPTSDDPANVLRSTGYRFEPDELYGELGEGRRVKRIMWFVVAVLAGSVLALTLLIH